LPARAASPESHGERVGSPSRRLKPRENPSMHLNSSAKRHHIGDFVERLYLPYVKQQKRQSTYRGSRQVWNEYLRELCGRVARTYHVQAWLEVIARMPRTRNKREYTLSKTTLAHVKNFISGVFRHASQQHYFDGVNPVTLAEIPAFAPNGKEGRAYSLEDINVMLRFYRSQRRQWLPQQRTRSKARRIAGIDMGRLWPARRRE
jgi:hypothetical protein